MKSIERIIGRVFKGQGAGSKIGFPTINLEYSGETRGVFVATFLNGSKYGAAVNLGARPTFGDMKTACEVHILDWPEEGLNVNEGDQFQVELHEKIRDVKKFDSFEELREQIAKDVLWSRSWYNDQQKN